jgi:hypothetical protein
MKNLSITLKKAFFVVALMIAAVLAYTPARAGEDGINSNLSGRDLYLHSNLTDNHSDKASGNIGLAIPLTGSLSLDLGLSSVGTGQVPPGEKKPDTPPIPITKSPGTDLRYSRLGVGLSFGF